MLSVLFILDLMILQCPNRRSHTQVIGATAAGKVSSGTNEQVVIAD
jgi:hypothetical protein